MLDSDIKRMRGILGTVLTIFMVGCGERSGSPPHPESSRSNPPASSIGPFDLDGRHFDLWQSKDGSLATVIVFTRSDCPISNRYAPTVRELYEAYQPRGVRFFLIYVDPGETPEQIRRHIEEFFSPARSDACVGRRHRGDRHTRGRGVQFSTGNHLSRPNRRFVR
jgi:hypothetical protein